MQTPPAWDGQEALSRWDWLHKLVVWEIDTYGWDVCTDFGEYYGIQRRILAHHPRWRRRLGKVSSLVQFVMETKW